MTEIAKARQTTDIIPVKTRDGSYNIVVKRGAISELKEYLNLERRVLIVTDSGVPAQYAKTVAKQCRNAVIKTVPTGEGSKSLSVFSEVMGVLVENGFTRSDCIIAVGGGVVGDLSGFVASAFMRGIDFYNIPTTLLSQVDSSIGGKTAINFEGYKNIVGAFYPPKAVVIDPDTLLTLDKRQLSNGLAEALKMSLTSDRELFSIFENCEAFESLDEIIKRSLYIKKNVVELDEHESGLRKILNFGHTLGHAVESADNMQNLYHGECVAIGMLPMCSQKVKSRLLPVLEKLSLPTKTDFGADVLIEACKHDKKLGGDKISVIFVEEIGSFLIKEMPFCEFTELVRQVLK